MSTSKISKICRVTIHKIMKSSKTDALGYYSIVPKGCRITALIVAAGSRVPSRPAALLIRGRPSTGPDWSNLAGGSRLLAGGSVALSCGSVALSWLASWPGASGRLASEPIDQAPVKGSGLASSPLKGWSLARRASWQSAKTAGGTSLLKGRSGWQCLPYP